MDTVFKYQEAAFPLNWLNKFNLQKGTNGFELVLTSQNISLDLAEVIERHRSDLEEEDLGSLLRTSRSNRTFATWMMKQYKVCRDAIRELLESDPSKIEQAIDVIA
jgi:hypothetical protein